MESSWTWLWQGVASNAVYGVLVLVAGIVITVLTKKRRDWLMPTLYGLIGMVLFGAALYSGSMYTRWPIVTPLILALSLIVAAGLHLLAASVERKQLATQPEELSGHTNAELPIALIEASPTYIALRRQHEIAEEQLQARQGFIEPDAHNKVVQDLREQKSVVKHWQGEVDREKLLCKQQVEIRDKQIAERGARIGELEQQLRVSQAEHDALKENLAMPKGSVRLRRVTWIARDEAIGRVESSDLKELFEDRFMEDGKLTIPPGLYHKLFAPEDPWRGHSKDLEIEFTHGGTRFYLVLPENVSVTLPFPYGTIQDKMT